MIDLGNGLLTLRAGDHPFHVDAVEWVEWMQNVKTGDGLPSPAEQARRKLGRENGTNLNLTQADAFLAAIYQWYVDLKKKQNEPQTWQQPTESIPSR